MFLRVAIIFLFFSGVYAKASAQNRIKWIAPSAAATKQNAPAKYYFLYFYYSDCKWCKHLEQTTFTDDYTARFINQKFHAVKIDATTEDKVEFNQQTYKSVSVGKYEFNELAVELLNGKMSFPAIVILDEKFNRIGVHQNYYNVDDFQMIMAYYAGGHYKTTLFRHYSNNYCKDSHFYNLVSDK